jgi:NAD-dependent deacetylase
LKGLSETSFVLITSPHSYTDSHFIAHIYPNHSNSIPSFLLRNPFPSGILPSLLYPPESDSVIVQSRMGGILTLTTDSLNTIDFAESDIGGRLPVSNTVECVISLIRRFAPRVVVITGAGISAHQLPTFRSDNNSGLWETFSTPLLDLTNFYENPGPPWKLLANVRNLQVDRILHPSFAHHAIHHLLARHFISHVITQNIDGLHSFATDLPRVIELHGAVSNYGICAHCNTKQCVDHLQILQTCEAPKCPICKSVLKPPVAFFGDAIEEAKRVAAAAAVSNCDVLILLGTHCTVDPVLSIAANCRRANGIIVEINVSATRASAFANVSLQGKADDIFLEIATALMPDGQWDMLKLDEWEPGLVLPQASEAVC